MSENEPTIVQNLFWANNIDESTPYETPYFGRKFCYVSKNVILDPDIKNYLQKRKRSCLCDCTDGCLNPKTCPCYKFCGRQRLCTY